MNGAETYAAGGSRSPSSHQIVVSTNISSTIRKLEGRIDTSTWSSGMKMYLIEYDLLDCISYPIKYNETLN